MRYPTTRTGDPPGRPYIGGFSAALLLSVVILGCPATRDQGLGTTIVVDDAGRGLELRAAPRRVITLAPNLTEIVVVAGGQSRLVGTDNYSDHPPSIKALPKVGDMQPNVELIAGLKPDLVFASSSANHPTLGRSLANTGIPLFVVTTDRLSDVYRSIERIGEVLDTEPAARAAAERLRRELESHRRRRSRAPRILFVVWLDPLWVAGGENFVDDLIQLTGGRNVVEAGGWPQYSLERLASNPPDLIVVAGKSRNSEQVAAFFRARSPWKELNAIKAGFWYVVDEDQFARPGPRVSAAAIELNRIFDQWERKSSQQSVVSSQ